MKQPSAAVLMFPGSNCELETAHALRRNGFAAEIVRWNESKKLAKKDAIVLVGGFSYEDRGRSGLIASHDPVMQAVRSEAERGALVLGICNGAQVLVESGMLGRVALAHNRRELRGETQGEGYYNAWAHIAPRARGSTAFDDFDGILSIPVAHGEGRFVCADPVVTGFVYVEADGTPATEYPAVPNGAEQGLAGVGNSEGTILALMPHPERAADGDKLFMSMRRWVTTRKKQRVVVPVHTAQKLVYTPYTPQKSEGCIRLTITDNEAISVEAAMQQAGLRLQLTRYRYVPHCTKDAYNAEKERALLDGSVRAEDAVLVRERGSEKGTVWKIQGSRKDREAAIAAGFFHNPVSMEISRYQ